MQAFVQQINNNWQASGSFFAWAGLRELGFNVKPYHSQELFDRKLKISRETIVNGGVRQMEEVFRQLDTEVSLAPDYPDSLKGFLGREMWTCTVGDIRAMEGPFDPPLFIKSAAHKAFDGMVLNGKRADNLIQLAHLANDVELLASEAMDFKSEWRFYILNKNIVGVGHYGFGDPLVFPDRSVVLDMIEQFSDAPISYSLDVGVIHDGRSLLVEINDSLSLGNYGCRSKPYAKMIGARWFQVLGMEEKMREFL